MGQKKDKNRTPRYEHKASGLPQSPEVVLDSKPLEELITDDKGPAQLSVEFDSSQLPKFELDQSYQPKMEDDGMLEMNQLEEQKAEKSVMDVQPVSSSSGDESIQALAKDVANLAIEETPEAKKARIEQAAYDAEMLAIAKSKLPYYRFTPKPEEIDAVRQAELKQDALMKKALDSRQSLEARELSALKGDRQFPSLSAQKQWAEVDGVEKFTSVDMVETLNKALFASMPAGKYEELNNAMGSVERVGLPKADVPKEPAKGVKPQAFAKAKEYTGTPVTPYQQFLADKQRKAELDKLSTQEGNSHHQAYQKLQRNGLLDTVVPKLPLLAEAVDQAHVDQVAQHISKPGM